MIEVEGIFQNEGSTIYRLRCTGVKREKVSHQFKNTFENDLHVRVEVPHKYAPQLSSEMVAERITFLLNKYGIED